MKKFLKDKISILFIFSILLIIVNLTILIFDFKTINDPWGYGILALSTGIILGLFGILIDFILAQILKNKWILNITEIILIVGVLYWVWAR